MSLTVKAVEAAKPQERPYKLTDGGGLYLFVAPTGLKSWRANYAQNGKQRTRTYGRYPGMTLAQARAAHAQAKSAPADAVAAAPAAKGAPTFKAITEQWLKIKLPSLSNGKHQGQVAGTLERFAFPSIGALPIDQIPRTKL
ncbi:MAG: Arm DNA-binding domain-containing protein, partial [Thiomonas arsenitoxydans]|nr:Arm DNA-binding domain-containing protein [Thiomonas arsenitoxydans]